MATTLKQLKQEHSPNNTNITMADHYNEDELDLLLKYENINDADLAKSDQLWLQSQGITFTEVMENLLEDWKNQPPPLAEPPLPTQVTESDQWQAYLASNKGMKSFVPTTDPEEIKRILYPTNPYFTTEKLKEGIEREIPTRLLRKALKTGVEAGELIGQGMGYVQPTSFALRKWEEQKELAKAGIPWEEGAPVEERRAAAFVPRGYGPRSVENIAFEYGEPKFEDWERFPAAEYLYPGRPQGEQGPIIRKQRNPETGEVEKYFPFNEPGVTRGDFAHYALRDAFPLVGDVAISTLILWRIGKRQKFYQGPWRKIKDWGAFAAASGMGTAAADFSRLAAGKEYIDPDLTYEEAMREAGLIGLYATGGAAAATAILSGTRAVWQFMSGKNPPDFMVRNLLDLKNNYQNALKKAGIKEGSPQAQALFDDILGRAPKEVQKRIQEVTGETYKIFLGEGQVGPEATFALGLLNQLEKQGLPATKVLDTLHKEILHNEMARNLFAQRLLLQGGSKEAAEAAAADLGQQLADETIPKLLNAEIDKAWEIFRKGVELGNIDQAMLKSLGFDDAAILGLKPATDALPGELGDDIAMSQYLFREIPDPTSNLAAFRSPTISRLHRLQRDYVKPVQKELDEIMDRYGGLASKLNWRSPLAQEIRKIMQGGGAHSILRKDKAFREYIIKNVDGPDLRKALARLEGRAASGNLGGGEAISFRELHDLRIDLHNLNNSLSGKLNEPSQKAVNELIGAVEAQQDLIIRRAGNRLKPKGQGIDNFMAETGFGREYWETLTKYKDHSRIANNRFVQNLMKRGAEFDESLIPALLDSNIDGAYSHPLATPLFKMLRDSGSEGFEAIDKIQRAVAQRYRRAVIEPFAGDRNYANMRKAHEAWMNKNEGLIRSTFPEEKMSVWKNMRKTQALTEKLVDAREKTLNEITEYFGDITGAADPAEIVLRIVRGEGLENVSGAMRLRTKLARMIKQSGDPTLKAELNRIVLKDIYNQIMIPDTTLGGMSGKMKLDPRAFTDLLTKDFPLMSYAGKPDAVSFRKLYEPFLTKGQLDDLYVLNAAVQSNFQREAAGDAIARASLGMGQGEVLDVSAMGKLIFGPLNPYTYRAGWRQRALQVKLGELVGEAVMDPKLLNKLAKQMKRKGTISQAVRFLYSLDSVIAHDVGRDLQLEYLKDDGKNPFRSDDYYKYLQEFFTSRKQRSPAPGVIPAREATEQIIPGAILATPWVGSKVVEGIGTGLEKIGVVD